MTKKPVSQRRLKFRSEITVPDLATASAARPLLRSMKEHALLLVGLLSVMWVVEGLDFVLPVVDLDQFGIRPRSKRGLLGILFSPFLHAGFGHLLSNSLPFLLLGGLVMTGGRRLFLQLSLWLTVIGGGGVWLLGGSGTVHVGASLLIFGFLGFLLGRGIAERGVGSVLVSLVLLFVYGGMLYGVLPGQPGISWLGHLCGILAGIAGAWVFREPPSAKLEDGAVKLAGPLNHEPQQGGAGNNKRGGNRRA